MIKNRGKHRPRVPGMTRSAFLVKLRGRRVTRRIRQAANGTGRFRAPRP